MDTVWPFHRDAQTAKKKNTEEEQCLWYIVRSMFNLVIAHNYKVKSSDLESETEKQQDYVVVQLPLFSWGKLH